MVTLARSSSGKSDFAWWRFVFSSNPSFHSLMLVEKYSCRKCNNKLYQNLFSDASVQWTFLVALGTLCICCNDMGPEIVGNDSENSNARS